MLLVYQVTSAPSAHSNPITQPEWFWIANIPRYKDKCELLNNKEEADLLRYGGRISLSNPPRYLEGSVKCFDELDSDEWGMMTLKEKVYEVGYNKEDNIRLFHLTDNGLLELHTDEDACVLVNCVVRPKSVEIWVVLGVVGDDETNDGEAEISADEGEGDSDWVKGDSDGVDGLLMQIGAEVPHGMNGEQIGVEVPQGMNGDQAIEQLATTTVQNQLGVEVPNQEEITIQTQPKYGSDLESIPVAIQIEHDDPANETFEIPVELVHLSSNELPGAISAHGQKPSYGPPPKKMKTMDHGKGKAISASQDKGKEVIASHHIARGKKSLGLTKSRKHCTKKYRTRSTTTFKSNFHGNVTAPINID
nr:uncharacterized protein LOC109184816 [Ipomoea trifida]